MRKVKLAKINRVNAIAMNDMQGCVGENPRSAVPYDNACNFMHRSQLSTYEAKTKKQRHVRRMQQLRSIYSSHA